MKGDTWEKYAEMCVLMGQEPSIVLGPPSAHSLPYEAHQALELYNFIPPQFAGMSGVFLGRDMSTLPQLLTLFNVSEQNKPIVLECIMTIHSVETSDYKDKQKAADRARKQKKLGANGISVGG